MRSAVLRGKRSRAKKIRREFKTTLDQQAFIPDQMDSRGLSYTAEKMHETRRQHAERKARPDKRVKIHAVSTSTERRQRELSKKEIARIADRAEARSKGLK
jgi:hypothetical protein